MRIRLEKQNRVHLHFVILTLEGSRYEVRDGKNEVLSVQSMTHMCETEEQANLLFHERKNVLIKKGYSVVDEIETKELKKGNFDKAKWHYGGDFPAELDQFQGYVHTGIFITWLIDNDLFSENSKLFESGIQKVKNRNMTGPEFYRDFLDGVFISDFLNSTGASFTSQYYDKGSFTADYANILCENFESLYEVEDNWINYDLIEPSFTKRYNEFLNPKFNITKRIINWLQQALNFSHSGALNKRNV